LDESYINEEIQMNTYLKESLKWITLGATVATVGITQGCSSASHTQLVCRHKAVACALAAGEIYGPENVKIARGPVPGDVQNHAQAIRYDKENNIVWLSNEDCLPSLRDTFSPNEYLDVTAFVDKIIMRRW
jgi:hypothetical protein